MKACCRLPLPKVGVVNGRYDLRSGSVDRSRMQGSQILASLQLWESRSVGRQPAFALPFLHYYVSDMNASTRQSSCDGYLQGVFGHY